jgi:hypothetical protein
MRRAEDRAKLCDEFGDVALARLDLRQRITSTE